MHLTEREEEAIAVYENALPIARSDATQYHLRGLIEICRRRYETAVREFEEATSLEPDNADHWHALGLTHLRAEHPVESIRAFDEALKINPDDIVALTYSHDPLCTMGRFKEVQQRVVRALKIDPDNVPALKQLADARSAKGLVRGEEGKRTRQLIRQALQLAPDLPDIHVSLARYYISRGDWEKGIAVLRAFVKQHPNSYRGWYYYAWWLFRGGDSQIAAEAITKAYALYQKDPDIYRAACEILPSAGRPDDIQLISTSIGGDAPAFS